MSAREDSGAAAAPDIYERARRIRLAIFDVDGVLTDGTLYYAGAGEELKAFNVRDGHGMKMLQASGVTLAIITSRTSRGVEPKKRTPCSTRRGGSRSSAASSSKRNSSLPVMK